MKDNFSAQAKLYANFRPHYPETLYDFLFTQTKNFNNAADIATGNGQVAVQLAKRFKKVYATDISAKQLAEAPQLANIEYKIEAAEATSFPDHYFDLVTVAQAIHWFDFEKFYAEVKRILRPDGLFAVIGYGPMQLNGSDALKKWFYNFTKNTIRPYWDKERSYVDDYYKTIPFPFTEIAVPALTMDYAWTKEQLIGYINTWSAVQHFIKTNNRHPLDEVFLSELNTAWGSELTYPISFALLLRAGH